MDGGDLNMDFSLLLLSIRFGFTIMIYDTLDYFLILDLVDLIFFDELLYADLQERMGST